MPMSKLNSVSKLLAITSIAAAILGFLVAGSAKAALDSSGHDAGHIGSGHDAGHVGSGHDAGHIGSGHDAGHVGSGHDAGH